MPLGTSSDRPDLTEGRTQPDGGYLAQLEGLLGDRRGVEATPHEIFSSVDDDFWFWAMSAGRRESAVLAELLPGLPPEERQIQTNGNSGDEALWEGHRIYRGFRRLYETHSGDLESASAILDFGCGWGRITRFFTKDVDPDRLWGVDVNAGSIAACRDTSRWGNFKLIEPYPPIDFPDATFDLVFCYSVFSHLAEDIHRQWIDEFSRILKPGGLLIASTREREFINRCAEVGLPFFDETDRWLERYDRGEFCFDTTSTYGEEVARRFGEACIPRDYVFRSWSQSLEILDFVGDPAISEQNVVVARPARP